MTLFADTVSGSHDERDLIRKARTGDRAAFGELYRRYAAMVHGLLLARVPPDVADDLLQEVFLKAMLQLNQLRSDDHFGAWIAAIARHRAVDHQRGRQAAPGAIPANGMSDVSLSVTSCI
jgi:RNA polymerase sigma-70 factor, ECF subfamily